MELVLVIVIINYAFSSTGMEDGRQCLFVVGDDHLTGWHPSDDVMPGWRVMPHPLCGASLARMESVM